MNRLFTILSFLICLSSPLWAQEVIEHDSLQVIEHDSLQVANQLALMAREMAEADSLARLEMSDTVVVDEHLEHESCLLTYNGLMQLMNRNHVWNDVPYAQLYQAAEEMELEGCAEVDSLLSVVDSIPYDAAIAYAQADLRMPLVFDAVVPQPRQTLMQYMQKRSVSDTYDNVFARQLSYASMRKDAMSRHAMSHLNQVHRMSGNGRDQDFSRKRIARKAFETTDLVISDAALDLGSATLDIEQVTFHADKWHRKGSTSLQVAQTALSSNWYKGGDNNMTMSTYDKLAFSRYDESMKTTLDITFELRLSGYYTAADTINPVRVNDNQFRLDVSYGYKAWKNWYYSTSFYAKTPIFDFHSANSKVTKSTFFSPLETNLGVGLDYKKQTQNKRINFNLMLAPLSYSMTAVCSDRVDERQFGLEEGETTLHQFGSSVTCKLDWKITDIVSWNTRFYYFSTYHKVQLEFENNFNFQLGKYCSAKLYYYPRLDDSRDTHLECKQMLTFGLSWVW